MSAENLILFVIFMLYVVAVILKRARRAARRDRSAAPAAKPQWREKLDRYMDQLKSEMESAAPAQENAGRDAWERLAPAEPDHDDAIPVKPPAAPATPPPAPAAGPAAHLRMVTAPAPHRPLPPEDASHDGTRPSLPPALRPPPLPAAGAPAVDARALRRAVIWSEILGPPLALREKRCP